MACAHKDRRRERCLELKHLGFNAIKESFDRLPTGVCFFDRTGSIVLCNRQMYQLSRFLLDSDMQYLGEVQEALSAPGGGIVRIPDIDNTYRFPDKTVWRFEKTEVTDPVRDEVYTAYRRRCYRPAARLGTAYCGQQEAAGGRGKAEAAFR